MIIAAAVLLVGVFVPVYYGLLSPRRYHLGVWLTDELCEVAGTDPVARGYHRREDAQCSWVPIPAARRILDAAGVPIRSHSLDGHLLLTHDPAPTFARRLVVRS